MFKVKLDLISVFRRLSLPAELFWTHFFARHGFKGSFSARHTKSVATPDLRGSRLIRLFHVKFQCRDIYTCQVVDEVVCVCVYGRNLGTNKWSFMNLFQFVT